MKKRRYSIERRQTVKDVERVNGEQRGEGYEGLHVIIFLKSKNSIKITNFKHSRIILRRKNSGNYLFVHLKCLMV